MATHLRARRDDFGFAVAQSLFVGHCSKLTLYRPSASAILEMKMLGKPKLIFHLFKISRDFYVLFQNESKVFVFTTHAVLNFRSS